MLPAFCRVVAVATPTSDSTINFEVWIPAEGWNGKFQGVGNSAWTGAIAYSGMAAALRRGYATASTDTGHSGDDLKFATGHPEKVIDWAYRAVHVMTGAAKEVVRANQGRLPVHSYFTGCSTAGAQGLTEAQRYPDDYDGIFAQNPGGDRTNRVASYLWNWIATHEDPASNLPPSALGLLNKATIAACDRLDGVVDGVIDDPRRCRFDPGTLQCHDGESADSCLTAAQVKAARKVYQGPRNPRTGEQIFPGEPPGSESFGSAGTAGWRSYVTAAPEPMRLEFWRSFVFHDPNWDWRTFDWDADLAYARAQTADLNATNTDLRAFKARQGRILLTAGWDDPIHPSEQTLNYYEAVVRASGGLSETQSFFRLFMVPGMGHCAAGPGPSTFDGVAHLESWVERGQPPDRIIASQSASGRTRPLCPHPAVARWNGTGSTEDAKSFSCTAAAASVDTRK